MDFHEFLYQGKNTRGVAIILTTFQRMASFVKPFSHALAGLGLKKHGNRGAMLQFTDPDTV